MQLAATKALIAAVVLTVAACAPASPQRCHRYDVASLVPENGFAATVPWDLPLAIDTASEHIEVALFVVRPVRAPVDLVHVVGDRETEHWSLQMADLTQTNAICWISPRDGVSNCGAIIEEVPVWPGGYYFLRPNGNTVLEAGLALYLCQ
jgi:hypothetical protein